MHRGEFHFDSIPSPLLKPVFLWALRAPGKRVSCSLFETNENKSIYKLIASGIRPLFITAIAIHLRFDALFQPRLRLVKSSISFNSHVTALRLSIHAAHQLYPGVGKTKQTNRISSLHLTPERCCFSPLHSLTKGGTVGSPLPSKWTV